ncbi:hypothetical protein FIC_01378 [Flavobacteriaceae bacterium 3519-10]|nr:hypothetical protein FIC_01378 [Flavobacteriaceae bacterium 3519-10]
MNNLAKNNRFLPIIGIVLILIGYFYLTYETFKLNEKRDLLQTDIARFTKEIAKLEAIKARLTTEIKAADSIRKIQNTIILKSADPQTVQKGIELNKKITNPESTFFTRTNADQTNLQLATQFEAEGYRYLFARDVENAIKAFIKSENSYNSFHQVYEISNYLTLNKKKLAVKDSPFWKEAYREIYTQFSWKMPENIQTQLKDHAK